MNWFPCSGSGGSGSSGHNYSTTEQKIGTWIDGSNLYEKVVVINSLTKDGSDQYVNHGIANINLVLGYEGFFSKSSNGRCTDKNTDTNTTYVCSVFEANRTQVAYAIGSGWDYDKCYVILRYTKTS